MASTVLTEFQGACRAAYEQVQMLQDLYEHLAGQAGHRDLTSINVDQRIGELRHFQELLSGKLQQQDLLPTRPDPEKEGLLELLTELKAAFGGANRPAASERLAAEEAELLQATGQLLAHEQDEAIADAHARTRDAIARLSAG
jgi:hypothetical protein